MNNDVVEKIANAVLYEGYMLYPYRPSAVKNQQRFNFGVLYPREYCELQAGSDNWQMQTECLVIGNAATPLEVKVRFLQLVSKAGVQQGIERAVRTPACGLRSLEAQPLRQRLSFRRSRRGSGTAIESAWRWLLQDHSGGPEPRRFDECGER